MEPDPRTIAILATLYQMSNHIEGQIYLAARQDIDGQWKWLSMDEAIQHAHELWRRTTRGTK